MSNLEIAKEIIRKNFQFADCGIFDCRGMVGDTMTEIYNENGLKIDICYGYAYFEVFGLSNREFEELCEFYESMS